MKTVRLFVIGLTLVGVSVALAAPSKKTPSSTNVAPQQGSAPSTDVEASNAVKSTMPVETSVPTTQGLPFNEPTRIIEPTANEFAPLNQPTSAGGDPINMNWYSINNGGAIEVAAGNIKMGLSIGQSAVGEVSAGNIKMGLGFWYGAGTGCACNCHADPANCDGITDVFDVLRLIDVAFRGDSPILDPNPQCPFQTTDVDCSGDTGVFDVTRMINVAFRGYGADTTFCTPCNPAAMLSAVPSQPHDEAQ